MQAGCWLRVGHGLGERVSRLGRQLSWGDPCGGLWCQKQAMNGVAKAVIWILPRSSSPQHGLSMICPDSVALGLRPASD